MLLPLTAINLAIQYLIRRHSFLISRHNFLVSRHNYKLSFSTCQVLCRLVRSLWWLPRYCVDFFFVICMTLTGQYDLKIKLTYLKIRIFSLWKVHIQRTVLWEDVHNICKESLGYEMEGLLEKCSNLITPIL